MPIKVLVVDDSSFFRRRISEIISSDKAFEVVGQGSNGQEAIDLTMKLSPDLITMDYEMPYLDGISAVKEIMRRKPTSILMFSSLTYEGARTTLDALEAGAKDFLPKSFESVSGEVSVGSNELLMRLRVIAKVRGDSSSQSKGLPTAPQSQAKPSPTTGSGFSLSSTKTTAPRDAQNLGRSQPTARPETENAKAKLTHTQSSQTQVAPLSRPKKKMSIRPKLCVIGSSTGGPMALQLLLQALPANSRLPILIAQHMPASFTEAFADRLNSLCKVRVYHAKNGDRIEPGCVYIAPGGMQTIVKDSSMILSILKGDERLNYKPSVDLTFASASKACPGKVLAVVLTGMGADGADGARLLKQANSEVWIQDEQSCVVFGMPQAVMRKGYYDDMMSIDQVGPRLAEVTTSGCT